MAVQIGEEARALGVSQLFAPVQDLARELRWGRVEETFGEDGYLAGEIGLAYVVGLQSTNVSALVQHFAADSKPEQGLNVGKYSHWKIVPNRRQAYLRHIRTPY